ncbi:phage portal protein [Castellaniella hirudinis]|uniref:phage portal protein n=1 Tax=Castellaniella hirudinis TaxID=1144617 RepID=UPI0039C0B87B
MGTKSGASVNHKNALEVTTVLACVRVISEGIAQVPFKLYRQQGDKKLPAIDHPLYRVLHRKPNSWMTSFELRETMAIHCALTGTAIAFVNRDIRGDIRELIPITAPVEITQNDDYSLSYIVTAPNGKRHAFPQAAIWHWRGPSWDGVMGMDIIKLAREAIGLAMATEGSHAKMQQSGAALAGIYSVDGKLDPTQYQQLRGWLDKEFDGIANLGRTRLLDRNAKFYPMSMTGIDAQLLETRKHQIEEVCRALRVMPIMVGYYDKAATYASSEQMFLAHKVHTLDPWYERIGQSAECQLLTDKECDDGYFVKFIGAGLMRGSHKERFEAHARALGSGGSPAWMTQDEVRDLEDLNPMGGSAAVLPVTTNTPKENQHAELDVQPT